MAYLSAEAVDSWLENSKFTVDSIDPNRELVCAQKVIGRLRGSYDTSTWVDESTSPPLVIQLVAMLYAAAHYRYHYSEDLEEGVGLNWAEWLEGSAEAYIASLLDGSIILEEGELTDTGLLRPAFYPNDESSIDDPAKFRMMMEF